MVRGGGNAPSSVEALAACCDRVFCAQGNCGRYHVLKENAATTLPAEGALATNAVCCEMDYAPDCVDSVCSDCNSPYAFHGSSDSGNGGFHLAPTNNPDGTVT